MFVSTTSCGRARQKGRRGNVREGLTERIPLRLAFRCETGSGSDADGQGRAASLPLIRSDTFVYESMPDAGKMTIRLKASC